MTAPYGRSQLRRLSLALASVLFVLTPSTLTASSQPIRARQAMVVSQDQLASEVGAEVMREGGNAIDAAVATAFALAVTYPAAGNIGGGGFLVYRPATGEPVAYDFREMAPSRAYPTMFMASRLAPGGRRARDGGWTVPRLVGPWCPALGAATGPRDRAGPGRISGV